MAKTVRPLVAATAALTTLIVGGCGRTIREYGPGGTALGATYAGPMTRTVTFSYIGYTFDPPGSQAPAITPDQAFVGCSQVGNVCPTAVQPTIYLARATTSDMAIANDGQASPIDHRLVYVLIWKNFKCSPGSGGPGNTRAHSLSPITAHDCLAIDLVDADTGDDLGLTQTNSSSDLATANANMK